MFYSIFSEHCEPLCDNRLIATAFSGVHKLVHIGVHIGVHTMFWGCYKSVSLTDCNFW